MTRILRRLMFLLLLVGLSAQARERVMLINAELHLDRDGRVEAGGGAAGDQPAALAEGPE